MKKLFLSFVMMLTATAALGATYYAVVDGVRYAGDSWENYAYVVAPEEGTMDRPIRFNVYQKPFTNVTKATFGSHVTVIPERMLQELTLEELVIGANVTEIGDYAFQQATLPEGYAFPFSQIKKITEVTIPAGVTELDGYTFMYSKITKLTIPKTLNSISAYDFESDKLEEITFEYGPDTLSMNDTAFGLWCAAKTVSIDRPFKWRQDRKMSFGYAETVTFGPHIKSIPDRALYSMYYLKKVTMTDNVKAIGERAFYEACSDEDFEMTMSKKLETIGKGAFAYAKIKSFTFPITVKEIGEQAFTSNKWYTHYLKDVYVPWLTPLAVKDSDPESGYCRGDHPHRQHRQPHLHRHLGGQPLHSPLRC